MDKIFLAQIEAGNYLLTAWDSTAAKATESLAREYDNQDKLNDPISELPWLEYADRYGVRVIELDRGVTEWT